MASLILSITNMFMNPFVSNAQRKRMFENDPKMAKERASKTPKGKKLPEHVKKKVVAKIKKSMTH